MIIDGQNQFSDLASGDSPTAIADNASAYVLDQNVKNGIFTAGGGAYKGMFIKAVVQAAFTTSASGTIIAVLQDSADNSSWADLLVPTAAIAAATAVAGYDLFAGQRVPVSARRYLRVVYRIATGAMTAGTVITFLTPDVDVFDLSQRQATGQVTAPSGASDESFANGVLGS